MSRWTAESDRDYYDEVEGQRTPLEYAVTCLACSREFYVRADEPPPYRCEGCVRGESIRRERQQRIAS